MILNDLYRAREGKFCDNSTKVLNASSGLLSLIARKAHCKLRSCICQALSGVIGFEPSIRYVRKSFNSVCLLG